MNECFLFASSNIGCFIEQNILAPTIQLLVYGGIIALLYYVLQHRFGVQNRELMTIFIQEVRLILGRGPWTTGKLNALAVILFFGMFLIVFLFFVILRRFETQWFVAMIIALFFFFILMLFGSAAAVLYESRGRGDT
jgi:hypothetical protein